MKRRTPMLRTPVRSAVNIARTLGIEAAPRVVVPSMPVPPYEPPIAPIVPPQVPTPGAVSDELEYETRDLGTTDMGGLKRFAVYETQRQWKAIDVFINTQGVSYGVNAVFSVIVYAMHPGGRSVVATGRHGLFSPTAFSASSTGPDGARLVCSARSVAQRYAVEVTLYDGPATAVDETFSVTVLASNNESPRVPSGVVRPYAASALIVQTARMPELSAVRLVGTNNDATAKLIQVFDSDVNPPLPPDQEAIFEFGLPGGAGNSSFVDVEDLKGYRFRNGFVMRAVTWPGAVVDTNVRLGALLQ